jgi:hypothetical protein
MRHEHQIRLPLILGLAATLLPGTTGFAKTATETQDALNWPPVTVETHPWTRWWWMGSAVDPANLDRELARYKAAGLGGVEVTPIYGVKGWEDRDIPYLTPKWMEMLDHAIASASALGMKTDMTTGTGWCFGGPTVSSTDANCRVVAATQDVQSGSSLTGTFSPATTQALMAFSPDGKHIDLTSKIGSDGRVDWTADGGPWKVYAISQKPSGVVVKRAAPGGAGPMLNPFYPAAMVRYMDWFAKPFAEYKPKLDAMFQDSYEYNSQWAPDFFAQFEKLRGYKLQDELPALLGNENDDRAARVKSDYRETISDIMTLESMPIWIQWAHDHGYLARYQAHGDPGNLLDLYAIADIPETEMIYLSRSILMSKFASSAAHVTGKKFASSETCTWLSEHFTETLAEVKYMVDDMFLAGINHIFYHGTAYSPDEAPWPGWCFYASTEMNPRNSIWHDVPAVNTYITRCQSVLQSGWSNNDVLVYFPIFDRWNDAQGMVQQFDIRGKWFESAPVGTTAHRLWDRGYAFDYISDLQLARIKLNHNSDGPMAGARMWDPGDPLAPGQNGAFNLGNSRYKAIVVPPTTVMPLETLKQLKALAALGIPVIFDTKLPDDVPGLNDLDTRRQAFKALVSDIKSTPHLFVGDVEAGLNAAGVNREAMTDHAGLHFVRRSFPGGLNYFIANRGDQPVDDWISLSAKVRTAEIMDPMTGKFGLTDTKPVDDAHTQVHLQLDSGQSVIVRTFFNEGMTGPSWPIRENGTPVELTGTWKVKFIAGGPTLPQPYETGTLGSWATQDGPEAQAFGGTALYSLTFDAPAGQRGPWMISLGKVCQSARVRLNGRDLGTVVIPPFSVEADSLLPKGNLLEVEVTSVSANRVRDMDIRHVPWKNFDSPGLLNVHYKPFDASGWPLTDCGLLGPVMLDPQIARN